MTTNLEGEGQRVGCRACDVVFRDRTAESLALVPCPACGLQGEVVSLESREILGVISKAR